MKTIHLFLFFALFLTACNKVDELETTLAPSTDETTVQNVTSALRSGSNCNCQFRIDELSVPDASWTIFLDGMCGLNSPIINSNRNCPPLLGDPGIGDWIDFNCLPPAGNSLSQLTLRVVPQEGCSDPCAFTGTVTGTATIRCGNEEDGYQFSTFNISDLNDCTIPDPFFEFICILFANDGESITINVTEAEGGFCNNVTEPPTPVEYCQCNVSLNGGYMINEDRSNPNGPAGVVTLTTDAPVLVINDTHSPSDPFSALINVEPGASFSLSLLNDPSFFTASVPTATVTCNGQSIQFTTLSINGTPTEIAVDENCAPQPPAGDPFEF